VAVLGVVIYLLMQRWLCDPGTERGLHWRGLVLKWACWPVVLAGTMLAIVRAEVPYIPTAKEAARGKFSKLAWPQLVLLVGFAATVARIIYVRLRSTPEASLELSSEAIWGMIGFAALPTLAAMGTLYAAWQSRSPAEGAPWDHVEVESIGGAS
jgi:cellulose synthase (UDP-forming)